MRQQILLEHVNQNLMITKVAKNLKKLVVKIKYTLFDIFILKGTVEQQQQKQIKTKLRTQENLE